MAATALRYQWFSSLLNTLAYDYVLTAHHADDNLETFLINLSRGSGLDGLTGIPVQNGCILRPLLSFSKAAILEYARENKLAWREDSSNAKTQYLRNAIRHRILPELKALHPAFLRNIQKTMTHLSGSKALLHQHTATLRTALFQEEHNSYKISVEKLAALRPQQPYLYELFKDFGFTERDDLAHILHASSGKQLFSATHRLLKDRDHIYIQPLPETSDASEFVIDAHTKKITSPVTLVIKKADRLASTTPDSIYVDKEKLKFPLTVRKWKKGDYFYPFGMQGKKKVSKFFKDEKYSLLAKEHQWLLCSGN
ncbi:MAG: tRNA lysidine(34) synthetase TilS, partial [Sinomicrobium sp.]|nr:tRNA lysidine(34) synthetase TilS [Sinomicrobium sp.]